jgi:hypothetical protein
MSRRYGNIGGKSTPSGIRFDFTLSSINEILTREHLYVSDNYVYRILEHK